MTEPKPHERFERLMLPHLGAAYALARWLLRSEDEANDAVQEAYLRALRFFGSFRGEDGRPWLLRIVRNACFELLARGPAGAAESLEALDARPDAVATAAVVVLPVNPEAAAIERASAERVRRCLREIPPDYREVLVLREMQGCSYREIAAIAGVPIGTVMSRLSRARRLLQAKLAASGAREDTGT